MGNQRGSSSSLSPSLIAALLVVAVAVVGGALLLIASRPAPVVITINPPPPTSTPVLTATPGPLTVYITGAVNQPGIVVTLAAGSRVKDALDAAGGASANADLERIDLAAPLHDGDHIHVYQMGESDQPIVDSSGSGQAQTEDTLVHVNHATLEQLETLPGIGPALAQRIIDYRSANGPFADLQALTAVKGIGDSTIQKLSGLVAFD